MECQISGKPINLIILSATFPSYSHHMSIIFPFYWVFEHANPPFLSLISQVSLVFDDQIHMLWLISCSQGPPSEATSGRSWCPAGISGITTDGFKTYPRLIWRQRGYEDMGMMNWMCVYIYIWYDMIWYDMIWYDIKFWIWGYEDLPSIVKVVKITLEIQTKTWGVWEVDRSKMKFSPGT